MSEKIPANYLPTLTSSLINNNSDVAGLTLNDALLTLDSNVDNFKGIDYSSTDNPLITTNPTQGVGARWINTTTGEIFVCTDAVTNLNIWRGSMGTIVSTPFSVFRYVSDNLGSGSSKTLTNLPIGEPGNNRLVVMSLHFAISGSATVTSVTIGGVTATLAASNMNTNTYAGIFYALVPNGTVATVVINWNTTVARSYVGIRTFYNVTNNTPFNVQVNAGGGTGSRTINISTPSNGLVLAVATGDSIFAPPSNMESTDYSLIAVGGGQDSVASGTKRVSSSGTTSTTTTSRQLVGASWA